MKKKRRPIRRRKRRKKVKVRQHAAYTVAALRKKPDADLVVIAKALAVDYRAATGEKKAALGKVIRFCIQIVEERRDA